MRKSMVILGVCLVLAVVVTGCDDDDGILPDPGGLGLNEVTAIAQASTGVLDAVQSVAAVAFSAVPSTSVAGNGTVCQNISIGVCDNAIDLGLLCNDLETACKDDAFCISDCQAGCAAECEGAGKECEGECELACDDSEECVNRFDGGSAESCSDSSVNLSDCETDGGDLDGTITIDGKTGIVTVNLTIDGNKNLSGDLLVNPQFGQVCFDVAYDGLIFSSGGLQLVLTTPNFPTTFIEQCVGLFPDGLLTVENTDFNSSIEWNFDGSGTPHLTVNDLGGNELGICTFDLDADTIIPDIDSSGLCPASEPKQT